MTDNGAIRLTQYARGSDCACKIPPGELEETISKLVPNGQGMDLIVGPGELIRRGDSVVVIR